MIARYKYPICMLLLVMGMLVSLWNGFPEQDFSVLDTIMWGIAFILVGIGSIWLILAD